MNKKILIEKLIEHTRQRLDSAVQREALIDFEINVKPELIKNCACYRCSKGIPSISYIENRNDKSMSFFEAAILSCGFMANFPARPEGNVEIGLNVPNGYPFFCAGSLESSVADHE